jgi:hypothetical protein
MNKETLRMQMLAGVITESEYVAAINQETEDTQKDSLNEHMIGGIVGVGAINQTPSRAKADYENAFEHFLGERYELKPNRERDDIEDVNEEEVEEVREDDEYVNMGLTDLADIGYKAGEKAFEEIKTKFKNKPDFKSFKKGYFQGFTDNAGSYGLNEDELEEGNEEEIED